MESLLLSGRRATTAVAGYALEITRQGVLRGYCNVIGGKMLD